MADRTESKSAAAKSGTTAKAAPVKRAAPKLSVVAPAKPAATPPARAAIKPARAAKPVEARPAPVAAAVKAAAQPVQTILPAAAKPAIRTPLIEGKPTMATNSFAPNFTAFVPTPENMQSLFGDLQTRAKASMEKSAKAVEDMSEFAKGNVEAVMTSGRVAVKGAETLGQDAAEYSKKSFETAAAALKSMVAAKSPTELFTLQSDYARKSFDAAVAEGSKLSEAWLKLAGEIVQPLSTRVAMAADKIKIAVN